MLLDFCSMAVEVLTGRLDIGMVGLLNGCMFGWFDDVLFDSLMVGW
jgi:hypothetical protein